MVGGGISISKNWQKSTILRRPKNKKAAVKIPTYKKIGTDLKLEVKGAAK